jgi:AP-2 complex subunit beta-1
MSSGGNDAKFFQRGKVHELQAELQDNKKDSKYSKRKQTLKKIVANMTMGNDMSALSGEMLGCLTLPDIEIKKMVYLFIVTYCKYKPEIAVASIPSITRDSQDENPLIRSLAIRNFSNMQVEQVYSAFCEPLRKVTDFSNLGSVR